MKPEEVLDNINNKILIQGRRNGKYLEREMMKVIIEALEKQMPKKPIYQGAQFEEEPTCPSCFRTLDEEVDISGCQMCLQRLDWGNEE